MVWVKRWALDTRSEIDGAGMIDPRVTHLWDAGNVVDQGFLERFGVDFGGLDERRVLSGSAGPAR